jgi:hypothetical protein
VFPNLSLAIDSLWKFLAVIGLALIAASLLWPLSIGRDYATKEAVIKNEEADLQADIALLRDKERANLASLHQHGVTVLRHLYDEDGKLKKNPPPLSKEISEKLEEHTRMEDARKKELTAAAKRFDEIEAKKAQVEVDHAYANTIDRYGLLGLLVGGLMALVGLVLWFKAQRLLDVAANGGAAAGRHAGRWGYAALGMIFVGLGLIAICLFFPAWQENQLEATKIRRQKEARAWFAGVKKYLLVGRSKEKLMMLQMNPVVHPGKNEDATNVHEVMKKLVAANPEAQPYLEQAHRMEELDAESDNLTGHVAFWNRYARLGIWTGALLVLSGFCVAYVRFGRIIERLRNLKTPAPQSLPEEPTAPGLTPASQSIGEDSSSRV